MNLKEFNVLELKKREVVSTQGGFLPLLIAADVFLGGVAAGFSYELFWPSEIREVEPGRQPGRN